MSTNPDNFSAFSEWGWCSWFARQAEGLAPDSIARVAAVDREQFLLVRPDGHFRARLAGSFVYQHQQAVEFPCLGDWVIVDWPEKSQFGIIRKVLPRRTVLRRKMAGNVIDYQLIAANVDYAMIVQSCLGDFNLKRLERYLVMVSDGGMAPAIVLSKTDLVDQQLLAGQQAAIRAAGITAPVITISTLTEEGVSTLRQTLLAGQTYCFLGSSGVGKSTLINRLLGGEALKTGLVSGTGEGRHTTVRRELLRLAGGALVIDNPGMRELGILGGDEGMASSYADILTLAEGCRFRDCTHSGEPGCAVLTAVQDGTVSSAHLENYLKIGAESEFYQLSHAEKRQKDREFGKFIKSVKKGLRR